MELTITAREIEQWAKGNHQARGQLPKLIRILINSTCKNITYIDFPAFDNSERRGWDGIVKSESESESKSSWIPLGESCWELSCNRRPQVKATSDFKKRSYPTSQEQENQTFVFVTPMNWPDKNKWIEKHRKLKIWKDIRVLDANDLEQRIEQSITAHAIMEKFLKRNTQKIETLDQIWKQWDCSTTPNLPKTLFKPAVEAHNAKLINWLNSKPQDFFFVVAESNLEALAFLCCMFEQISGTIQGAYDRAFVIRSEEGFDNLRRLSNPSNYTAIIPSTEVENVLAGLQNDTHTIIVQARNTFQETENKKNKIELGNVDGKTFQDALREIGFSDPEIARKARESAFSPTILRRRLLPVGSGPSWANNVNNKRMLVPFMLVGMWNTSNQADKEIIKKISGKSYEAAECDFNTLKQLEESPVLSIDTFRGVYSKYEAFHLTRQSLTENNLKDFLHVAENSLQKSDVSLELKRGICDTLVLLSAFGEDLCMHLSIDFEVEIENLIGNLLDTSKNDSAWLVHLDFFDFYAEAAPERFLCIVESDLKNENPMIKQLFDQNNIFVCFSANLLWALELLAWDLDFLTRVIKILAQMCDWHRDNNITNSPINSLKAIFQCYRPQTVAIVEQRNLALEILKREFPKIGWQVCLNQFNPYYENREYYTKRPRWRRHLEGSDILSQEDMANGRNKAVELALNWSHDENTLGDLIERYEGLISEEREQLWKCISDWNETNPTQDQKEHLRDIIRRYGLHNSDAKESYLLLESENPVTRHKWLFQDFPDNLISYDHEDLDFDYQKRENQIIQKRKEVLQEIWRCFSFEGVKKLCQDKNYSYFVGNTMATILNGIQSYVEFSQNFLTLDFGNSLEKWWFFKGFFKELDSQIGSEVLANLLQHFSSDKETKIQLLICAPLNRETLQLVNSQSNDVKTEYWEKVNVPRKVYDSFTITTLVKELLKVDRALDALRRTHSNLQDINTPLLIRLLKEVLQQSTNSIDDFYISEALNILEKRGDCPTNTLVELELSYISRLRFSKHGIPNLEAKLSQSPMFFMKALVCVYKREDEKDDPSEWKFSEDNWLFYELFNRYNQVPGTQKDGSIDLEHFNNWITQVRNLSQELGRIKSCEAMIGKIVSNCLLGDKSILPCHPVLESIEHLLEDSVNIREGFVKATFSKYDKYSIEEKETLRNSLAESTKDSNFPIKYPHTNTAIKEINKHIANI